MLCLQLVLHGPFPPHTDHTDMKEDLQGQVCSGQWHVPSKPASLEKAALVAKPSFPWNLDISTQPRGKAHPTLSILSSSG